VPPRAAGGGKASSLGGTGGGSCETVATIAVGEVFEGAVGEVEQPDVNATINAMKNDNVPAARLAVRTRTTQTINS
jgi:hypothetical protein